jgi:dihydrolipoamide dehydrogenase
MPAEIKMPQLSDTMTEGTVVKWNKREGDRVKAGEAIAEVETDKATMPMEAFEAGTVAAILVKEGERVPVGGVLAVLATGAEKVEDVKRNAGAGGSAKPQAAGAPAAQSKSTPAPAGAKQDKPPAAPVAATPAPSRVPPTTSDPKRYDFDLIVIGGGPAGYAAAIRAGQLKKRVLCVEKENLGGTCLNWGCIPTKALLEDGNFVRKLRTDAGAHGVSFDNLKVDFAKIVGRSRAIADKLQKGIGSLFKKYEVRHVMGTGQLLGPHRVRVTSPRGDETKEATADHVIIAVGARSTELPFLKFDGKTVITSREAMTLPTQPKRMAIIGAGAIGCEFADFYNAIGTEVTVIEMLDHLLPNEDDDVSILLERLFAKRGIDVRVKTKTDKAERTNDGGVRLTLSGAKAGTLDADVVLVAVGVTGNVEGLAGPQAGLETFKNRVKVTPDYRTNLENVWAVGDCVALHWPEQEAMGGYRHPDLAHVAHHEAVLCVERIAGFGDHGSNGEAHAIDYKQIPGCTYTHPQVASMGYTEKRARETGREIKIGKFPFSVSGRALAAGETDGFVKLIFDAKYGELLGVHMIGENVTELLGELVLARKLEATEKEIIEAMHPHPTISEAVMEAAGVAVGRAIHL